MESSLDEYTTWYTNVNPRFSSGVFRKKKKKNLLHHQATRTKIKISGHFQNNSLLYLFIYLHKANMHFQPFLE